ncbi:MAG: transcriptional repressor LexA [Planctomycetia bacterium]|jgi:repressor LexA
MITPTLTKRQTQIFKFIRDLIKTRGYGPTVREIGDKFKISSPNGVVCHLRALEKKGLILRQANRSRAMQVLVDPFDTSGLPVTGEVIEGELVAPDVEERIDFGQFFNDPKCFVLKVESDSLKDDRVSCGDYLVVRKQRTAKKGQMVVAVDEKDKVSLLGWYPEKNRVRLQPTNKRKKAISAKKVKVLGLLVGVVRKTT